MQNNQLKQLIHGIRKHGIIDSIGDAVSIQDTSYRILYQNKKATEIIGGHVGEYCYQAIERRNCVCKDCPLEMSFKDGKARTVERRNPVKSKLIVEITTSAIKDTRGQIMAGVEIVRDISRRKEMEEELRGAKNELAVKVRERTAELESTVGLLQKEIVSHKKTLKELEISKLRLSSIFDQLDEAVLSISMDRVITYVNTAMERMFDYSRDAFLGQSTRILHVDDDHHVSFGKILNSSFERDDTILFEFEGKRRNGEVFPTEHIISLLRDNAGRPTGFIGVIRDITESKKAEELRKAAELELEILVKERTAELASTVELFRREIAERKEIEEELKKSRMWLSNIYNSLDEAVLVLTPDGVMQDANMASEKILGYSVDDLIDHSAEIIHVDRKHHLDFERRIDESFSRNETAFFEFKVKRKDGEVIPTEHTVSLLKDGSGDPVGIVSMIKDITVRKKEEKKLQKAEKNLRIQARELMESNAALKVLLKQREHDQKEFENNILSNVKHLIMPYIEKMKRNREMSKEFDYLTRIEANLKEIMSPFSKRMSFQYMDFTPKEILVADLIKDGKQDKDIAEVLNISLDTVKFHRKNIRKKLGIYGKKANLRTQLLSLIK